MNQQTEGKRGFIQGKSHLTELARKIVFLRMLSNPVFILVYWYFCRTLYHFCMFGGVKKRVPLLVLCTAFFVMYLILYCIRIRRMKVAEAIPEQMGTVKWYGYTKDWFYRFEKGNTFCAKKCDGEEKDYLYLKYSALPVYKNFFWKIPACVILCLITGMTVWGVIKSGTNLNGKLAWKLFEWKQQVAINQEQEDSTIALPESEKENIAEPADGLRKEEDTENKETDTIEYPDDELYGRTELTERYYENENGETEYHYEVYQYYLSDVKFQKVNETLQSIYSAKALEYEAYYETKASKGGFVYPESEMIPQGEYEEKTWYLVRVTYVGEDYVSILFNEVTYWPGAAHPNSYFSPVTIKVESGEVMQAEEILGRTQAEVSREIYGDERLSTKDYGFYLYGEEVHFIYRFNRFVEEVIVPREVE